MKKIKAPRLVTVAVFTTITIIFWVFYSLYVILTSQAPLDIPPEILNPISPDLDIDTLNQLGTKLYFEQGTKIVVTSPAPEKATPTPTETSEETPVATISATTPTPIATQSANLSPTTIPVE